MLNSKMDEHPTFSFLSTEPNDMTEFGLTPDMEAAILAAGAATGAAKAKPKAARKTATCGAWADAKAGVMPRRVLLPASNAYSQRHIDALLTLAEANDRAAVEAYVITGTNTYSRILRSYRDACLCFLDKPMAIPLLPKALSPVSVDDSMVANSVTKPKSKRKPAAKKEAA